MSDYVDTDCIMGPIFESSSEEARHHTCCMLILGVCTDALRKYLSSLMSDQVGNLRNKIDANESILINKFTKKQKEKIFVRRNTSFGELDFSLIYILLRNICNLSVSGCNWGETPKGGDNSIIACCERIREMRNDVVHLPMPEINSKDLENYAEKARMVIKAIEKSMSETYSEQDSKFLKKIDFYIERKMECNASISMELLDALEIKRERIDTLENKVDGLEKTLEIYTAEIEKKENIEANLKECLRGLQEKMKSSLQEEIRTSLHEVLDSKLEKSMQELQRNVEDDLDLKLKPVVRGFKTKSEKLHKDVQKSCEELVSLKRKCDKISNETSTEIEAMKRKSRKMVKPHQEMNAKLKEVSEETTIEIENVQSEMEATIEDATQETSAKIEREQQHMNTQLETLKKELLEQSQKDMDAKLKTLEKKFQDAMEDQNKKKGWSFASLFKK